MIFKMFFDDFQNVFCLVKKNNFYYKKMIEVNQSFDFGGKEIILSSSKKAKYLLENSEGARMEVHSARALCHCINSLIPSSEKKWTLNQTYAEVDKVDSRKRLARFGIRITRL